MKNAILVLARKFGKINTLLSLITGWILFAMTVIVFYAVVMRYAFQRPPMWTTETSTFMLLFITFIPLGFVLQHNRHMSVDFFTDMMSKRSLRVVNIFNALMAAGLFIVLTWQAVLLVMMAFKYHWVSMEMNVPLGYPYLILPFGCAAMILSCLVKAVEEVWPEDTGQK